MGWIKSNITISPAASSVPVGHGKKNWYGLVTLNYLELNLGDFPVTCQ